MARSQLDYDLIRIAADLKDAFENAAAASDDLKSQIIKGINQHEELFKDFQKKEKIFMAKAMPMAFTHSEEEVIEDSFDEAISMLEAFFNFAVKATSLETVKSFGIKKDITPQNSEGYQRNKAPILSKIFKPQ